MSWLICIVPRINSEFVAHNHFFHDELITQLRRAKRRAYKKKIPSWKYFDNLLKRALYELTKRKGDAVN